MFKGKSKIIHSEKWEPELLLIVPVLCNYFLDGNSSFVFWKKLSIWNKDIVQNVLDLFTHLRTSLISSEFFLITCLLRDFQFVSTISKTVKIVHDALVIVRAKTFEKDWHARAYWCLKRETLTWSNFTWSFHLIKSFC